MTPAFPSHARADAKTPRAPALSAFAQVVSIVFHPLLITLYTALFLAYLHPAAFSGMDPRIKGFRIITVFICSVGFPALTIFLASRLKLVQSIALHDRKDRIVGYLVAMFFYWWQWNVFHNLSDTPPVMNQFTLGVFLAVCGGWMCNIFFRISMHAIGVGGLVMFLGMMSFHDPYASPLYLSAAILIAGLVCTARLILSAHSGFEILAGLVVGALMQWIGWVW